MCHTTVRSEALELGSGVSASCEILQHCSTRQMEAQCRDSFPRSDLVCILTPWQNFMGEIKKRKKKLYFDQLY